MQCVELFAGAGGLALGISKAGFKHEAIMEWNKCACKTIRKNMRNGIDPVKYWPLFEGDVRNFDYLTVESTIHLVSGGPPCQPFSIGGKHRAYMDDRDMFPAAIHAVRELRPRAFLFENVKGLTRKAFAEYFEYIRMQLTYPDVHKKNDENWPDHFSRILKYRDCNGEYSLTYDVGYKVLNAADYGVSQKRERVFIVGFRGDLGVKWSFPDPSHSRDALVASQWITGDYWQEHRIPRKRRPDYPFPPSGRLDRIRSLSQNSHRQRWRTVRDAISDLPDPLSPEAADIANHAYCPGAKSYPGHTGSRFDEPAKVLKAGDHGVPGGENMLAYDDGKVRYFTVRESARLQAFPDEFVFSGSWTEIMRQLGNAVPVTLAAVVAKAIGTHLEQIDKEKYEEPQFGEHIRSVA